MSTKSMAVVSLVISLALTADAVAWWTGTKRTYSRIVSPNLIQNPGFEQWSETDIPRWTPVTRAGLMTVEIDTSIAHSGRACLHIVALPKGSFVAEQTFRVKPGHQYRMGCWMRGEGRLRMRILMTNSSGKPTVCNNMGRDFRMEKERWNLTQWDNMIFNDDVDTIQLRLYSGSKSRIEAWVDDVFCHEVEDATFPLTDVAQYQPPSKRPYLWSPEEVRQKVEKCDWAKEVFGKLKRLGEGWVSKSPEMPEVRYRDPAYQAKTLGTLWHLTGDERYLRAGRDRLMLYPQNLSVVRNARTLSGGKFGWWMCYAYDSLYDGLSADEREAVEQVIRLNVDRVSSNDNGSSNIQARSNACMAIAGFALEDEELVRRGITNINGFDYFIRYYLDDDGGTAEGSSGYLTYMMTGYVKTMEPARRCGLDLWQYPKAQKYFSLVARLAFPNFHLPAFGDGDYGQKGRGFYHLETARQRFHSPALNWLASAMRRDMAKAGTSFYTQDMVLRQVGLEPPLETTAYQPKSENLTDFGYAVLRTGEGSGHIAVGFTYGLPAGHGHNDRLGIVLYGLEQVLAPDGCLPGFKQYQDPVYFSYFQRAVSHNTATVDETCCRRSASRSEFFGLSPRIKCVSATNEEAYPGVRQQRTLVLTDAYVIDLFSLRSDTPRRYDWVYHNFGELSTDVSLEPIAGVLGATTGYDCITEVRKGWADASWAATWDLGEKGKLVLKMAAKPGTQVCSGKVLRYDGEVSQDVPMVIARRWGAATDYVTAIEPAAGDSTVRAIHALTGDDHAVGARVEEADGTCIVAIGNRESTLRSTDGQVQISLKGKFGAACFGGGNLRYAYLVEGQALEAGALRLAVHPEATVYVETVSPKVLSVHNQSQQPVTLTLKAGDTGQRIESLAAGATRQLPAPGEVAAPPAVEAVEAQPVRPSATDDARSEAERPGDNLVRNPGFEEGADGLPSDWQPFDYSPNRSDNPIMWSRDDQVAHAGRSSVQIPALRSYMDITKTNGCMQQVCAHGGGKTFIVSAWVKAAPPLPLEFERYYRQKDMLRLVRPTTRVRLFLCGYRPGWGWEYAGASSPVFQVGTEWQMITHEVSFPPGITKVNLILTRPYQIGKAPVWFDDVSVTMVGRGAE